MNKRNAKIGKTAKATHNTLKNAQNAKANRTVPSITIKRLQSQFD